MLQLVRCRISLVGISLKTRHSELNGGRRILNTATPLSAKQSHIKEGRITGNLHVLSLFDGHNNILHSVQNFIVIDGGVHAYIFNLGQIEQNGIICTVKEKHSTDFINNET